MTILDVRLYDPEKEPYGGYKKRRARKTYKCIICYQRITGGSFFMGKNDHKKMRTIKICINCWKRIVDGEYY